MREKEPIVHLPRHVVAARLRRTARCAAALLALGFAASALAAERHALIIGASDYALLPSRGESDEGPFDLEGPANDVARMIRMARQLGVGDRRMTVLADKIGDENVKADGQPTRAAIVDALEKLVRRVRADDLVLFYFSGHGSQQPDSSGDESDGHDEILLPIDIGPWSDEVGTVQNAISDDELGSYIEAMRAKGAYVWVIIDACHSGTALRGGLMGDPEGVETRLVPSRTLGIPASALRGGGVAGTRGGGADEIAVDESWTAGGGVTAFYAATSAIAAKAARWQRPGGESLTPVLGLLTYSITEAVAEGQVRSYRDLAVQVLARYHANRSLGVAPAFEGDFERAIFGHSDLPPRQWRVVRRGGRLVVEGGVLDGVYEGAVLAISQAQAAGQAIVAYARVERSLARSAELTPVAFEGLPESAADSIGTMGAYLGSTVAPGVSFVLRVARPPGTGGGAGALVAAAVDRLQANPSLLAGVQIELVAAGEPADVHLHAGSDRIWLADQPSGFDTTGRLQPPYLPLAPGATESDVASALAARLRAIARAQVLLRVMDQLELGEAAEALRIELFVDRASRSHARGVWPETEACADPARLPRSVPAGAVPLDRLDTSAAAGEGLRHCDVVYVRITNVSDSPVDVTPLYFDRESGITYLQSGLRSGVRIMPKASQTSLVQINTFDVARNRPYPLGVERLVVVAVQQPSDEVATTSYAYLAQSAAPPVRATGDTTPLDRLLDAAGFGVGGARRAVGVSAENSAVWSFGLEIVAE